MSRAEYAFNVVAEFTNQPLPDIDRINHPVWLPDTLNGIGDEGDTISKEITPEELIVGWSLVQMYGEQLTLNDGASTEMPRKTLPERLASILLDLSFEQDGLIQDVTFQDLALALDTHRETAASVLRAFRRQGLVDLSHRRILIQDIAGLVEIAGEPDVHLV